MHVPQSGGLGVPSSNLGAPTNNTMKFHALTKGPVPLLPRSPIVEAMWKQEHPAHKIFATAASSVPLSGSRRAVYLGGRGRSR